MQDRIEPVTSGQVRAAAVSVGRGLQEEELNKRKADRWTEKAGLVVRLSGRIKERDRENKRTRRGEK